MVTTLKKYLGEERRVGTYVEARYTAITRALLSQYSHEQGIPLPIESEQLHTTILYSRAPLPNIHGIIEENPGWKLTPKEFRIFEANIEPGEGALVLLLEAPKLIEMHANLRAAGGTHDYDDYVPHVTLTYRWPEDKDIKQLPIPTFQLEVELVRGVELDLDWGKK
jgi:hypothetical protein